MKYIKTDLQYTFNPAAGTLDFTASAPFNWVYLMAIINITSNNTLMYAVGVSGLGGTISSSGDVLTLTYNTTAMGANDTLIFIYDEGNDSLTDLLSAATGLQDPDASIVVPYQGVVTRPLRAEDLLLSILNQLRVLNFITLQASGLPDNLDDIVSSVVQEDA